MNDYNDGIIPEPCLRLSYGFGQEYASVELGDGTGYVRVTDELRGEYHKMQRWYDDELKEALDENAKLCNEVELTKRMYAKVSEDLCAEQADNERLRQELAIREESEQEKCIGYLRQENIDWEDRYRELAEENVKLRELVRDMWQFTGVACKKYPRLFDPSAQGGQMVNPNMIDAFEQRMRELGIAASS